jgi:hypothetical protein
LFAALASSLEEYHRDHTLPVRINIQRPFGPLEMPESEPETEQIPAAGILELAGMALSYITETNHLPSHLQHDGKKIGTGSLLALFSEMYVKIQEANPPDYLNTVSFEAYPSANDDYILPNVAACKDWPVHREDLDMSHLIEMTKLQLWTLKPAREMDHN